MAVPHLTNGGAVSLCCCDIRAGTNIATGAFAA